MKQFPRIDRVTGKVQLFDQDKSAHVVKLIRRNKIGSFSVFVILLFTVMSFFTKNNYIFLVTAFLYCLNFFIAAIRAFQMRFSIDKWPSAIGTITRSEIEVPNKLSGNDESYEPSVWYDYHVDGKEYTGYVISYGVQRYNTESKKSAAKVVSRYPLNSEVKVFYDPKRPEVCCLKTTKPLLSIIISLLISALSGYAFYFILTENLGFHIM